MVLNQSPTPNMALVEVVLLAFALIVAGFLLMVISLLLAARGNETKSEAGGVIMIGPVPIVFGTSKNAALAAAVAALVVLGLLLFLLALLPK